MIYVLAFIGAFWHLVKMDDYHNIIELAFYEEKENLQQRVAELRIREVDAFLTVSRYTNIYVGVEDRLNNVTVYECASPYGTMTPNKFLHGGFMEEGKYAVIGEELAVLLFSYIDCVGKEVFISGHPYIISGVTARRGLLMDTFGSMDIYAVYVNSYESQIPAERTSLVVRCREGASGMVLSRLSASGFHERMSINYDATARFSQFIIKLLLLIGVLLPLFSAVKRSIAVIRVNGVRLFHDRMAVGTLAIATLLFCTAIYLVSSLHLALDARAIPASLASFSEILNSIRIWFIHVNTGVVSGGSISPILRVEAKTAGFFAITVIVAGLRISRIIRVRITTV